MLSSEKQLLECYFVNQGIRLDSDLENARVQAFAHPTERSIYAFAMALASKTSFDKFQHDVCTLLHFYSE